MARKFLTAAEADVLIAILPPGMTREMKDVAYCLFEALVLMDGRAGQAKPDQAWAQKLQAVANMSVVQLQHLAHEKGGRTIYLSRGLAMQLSARDREMCAKFRGNYDELADEYDLTPMRVRQIVDTYQREMFLSRQQQLPGLD